MKAFTRVALVQTLVIGILLSPPVFDRFFVMEFLFDGERAALWVASTVLAFAGMYVRFGRRHTVILAFVLFNLFFLTSVELASRLGIKLWLPEKEVRLAQQGNMSYDDLRVYRGHPFVQFTGVPSRQLVGNRALGELAAFNNFGFVGEDFTYRKPPGVIRVAALGASTTARGYPRLLQEYLSDQMANSTRAIEVMNFGLGFFTTAHSVTNFVLNVVDFAPDYVVIHHGWNDLYARAGQPDFRSDYGHHLKTFTPPHFVVDRYLLRISVIYRAIKFKIGPPQWLFVEDATQVKRVPPARPLKQHELETFRRNIETIIDLATLRQMNVVLTTMPHTTDKTALKFSDHPYIGQFNEVSRLIGSEREQLIFVDLDNKLTGHIELFVDLAHMTIDGDRLKAQLIGDAIAQDLRVSRLP